MTFIAFSSDTTRVGRILGTDQLNDFGIVVMAGTATQYLFGGFLLRIVFMVTIGTFKSPAFIIRMVKMIKKDRSRFRWHEQILGVFRHGNMSEKTVK
jgi:uncharacterized ion transporter superfamily protein YfcC